jgi:LCP family protein required for cell wall assembly
MAVIVLAASAALAVAYNRLNGNITSEDLSDKLGKRPESALEGATNILLLGSDTRAGQGKKYGKHFSGARSDTTVLLHLSEGRRKAVLVSIPRDSWIRLPSCQQENGEKTQPYHERFNAAFTIGGTACTIKTVERLTDVYIDHYVVIDFAGFERMIDAMGGVEVCVEEAVNDRKSGLRLPAGRSQVGGKQALAFARTRYGLGDGSDLSRIERQQALMSAMIRKAKSSELLLNPRRLYGFLDAATKSITTDPGLGSLNEMRKLAMSVKGLETGQVRFVTVPNMLNPDDPATVVWTRAADALWEAIRTDSPLPGDPATKPEKPEQNASAKPTVKRSEVRVTVLNGSGEPGVAGEAADDLTRAGFEVVGVGNADSFDYERSLIRYSGEGGAATTLASVLRGVDSTQAPTAGPELELVIGKNYTGVQGSSADASPTPTPTISARRATNRSCTD